MPTDIGPKIGIQGEAQFRRELSQINTDLKTLGSEMKLVTSEFVGNEKSTESLTAQNQVLEATIVELTQKQQLLEQQLVKTAAAYGSDSKQAQALQQQYNNTTAQINTMTAQVAQNNQQIGSNSGLLGKLGNNLNTVAQKFGLSSSSASKLTSVLGSSATVYAAVGAAVVKLVGNLNNLAIKQAEVVDGVNTMAMKYHTTSQAIDAFNYTAKFTDVATETMLGSLSKLTRSMDSARTGTGAAAEAFQRLGVAVTNQDGSLRSSHEVFMDVIDALRNVSNETERDAAAMDIFGKSAMELNGVIEAGSEGLRGYMEEAAKFGVVISEQANENLQDLQNTKDQVDSIAEAAKTNVAAAWAPVAELLENIRGGFWMTVNELATAIGGFTSDEEKATDAALKFAAANGEVEDALNGVTSALDAGKSSRAEYLEDFLEKFDPDHVKKMTEAQKEYLFYLQNLGDYYNSIGVSTQTGYRMGFNEFEQRYNAAAQQQTQVTVNATIEVDGAQLARTTFDAFQNEANRRGPNAFGGTSRNNAFS